MTMAWWRRRANRIAAQAAPGWQLFSINAVWFGTSFLWNAIHPLLLPTMLLSQTEGTRNTRYGLLTFGGLLVAMAVQPLSGALSDHTVHRLGRRRPWMILGLGLGLASLWAMVLARGFVGLALGYILLQLCSNILHGAAQGLIPDLVPPGRRGVASGAKSAIDMLGVVAAALVISRILDGVMPRVQLSAVVIALVWTAGTLITVAGAHEQRADVAPQSRIGGAKLLHGLVGPRSEGLRAYARLLVSRYCVLLGTYMVQSFAFFFLQDVLQLANPGRTMGNIMSAIAVCVLLAALPAGALSEHLGRRRLSLWAEAVVALGMVGLAVWRQAGHLWLLGGVIGLGMGVFTSVNWAWATDLVPIDEPARYLGLSNLATAGAAATSRLAGPLIDLINARWQHGGYIALFALATLAVGMALLVTWRLPEPVAGRELARIA
ncbi:MAG: MFS transporter [Anaerolineae bacterium]|jgi:Na+/melibiose symporter-like transporter